MCVIAVDLALDVEHETAEALKILVGVTACELEWACWYRARQKLAQRSLFHS